MLFIDASSDLRHRVLSGYRPPRFDLDRAEVSMPARPCHGLINGYRMA